jgi:uncharacterized membrane protein
LLIRYRGGPDYPEEERTAVLVQHSVVINRPVEEVFAALVDFEADPEWQPAVLQSWHTPPGPVRIGTRTYQVRKVFGRRMEYTSIVTNLEPNRMIVCMSLSGVSPAVCTTYMLEPINGGTKLIVAIDLEIRGMSKGIAPLLKYRLIKDVARRFATLKGRLECR